MADAINDSIYTLQISSPNISPTNTQNVLIATYCRVVVNTSAFTASEKWSRVHQFESAPEQQITANMASPGTLIVANIRLPPAVFGELRSQAAAPIRLPHG